MSLNTALILLIWLWANAYISYLIEVGKERKNASKSKKQTFFYETNIKGQASYLFFEH